MIADRFITLRNPSGGVVKIRADLVMAVVENFTQPSPFQDSRTPLPPVQVQREVNVLVRTDMMGQAIMIPVTESPSEVEALVEKHRHITPVGRA